MKENKYFYYEPDKRTTKQKLKEAWKDGMLYKFYAWLSKPKTKEKQNA